MALLKTTTIATSTVIRIAAYIFFRWIPASFIPQIIYTALAIYLPSFFTAYLIEAPYKILAEEVDVYVEEAELSEQPPTYPSTAAHSVNLPDSAKPTTKIAAVEAVDTVVLKLRHVHFWRTLFGGYPSPRSHALSLLTLLLNLLLATGMVDQIYRGPTYHDNAALSFARTGYVSHNAAKILIRQPESMPAPVYVSYREATEGPSVAAWKSGAQVTGFGNDTDFTGTALLRRLMANTRYEWATSNNQSGSFSTAPVPGRANPPTLTFLTTSCIKPNFPYNPLAHPLNIPGLRHLAAVLPELKAKFMLFLGDFIYIDVPQRLGMDVETYRKEYRMVYGSPDWPAVSKDLPWIHVIDDHEIANDWDKNVTEPYPQAVDPFNHYHASVNPPEYRNGRGYFSFVHGPASFFMLEARKYRSAEFPEAVESPNKTMLGAQQLSDVIRWLQTDEGTSIKWKILVSSGPFTKNWRFGTEDTWGGYLSERQKLLTAMWDVQLRTPGKGVIILSGDRHEFAATRFPPPIGSKWPIESTVTEFSCSPLSQFYLPKATYRQSDNEDVMIKYIPNGQSKFGVVDIKSFKVGEQSELVYRLYVDGKETWRYSLTTPVEDKSRSLWT